MFTCLVLLCAFLQNLLLATSIKSLSIENSLHRGLYVIIRIFFLRDKHNRVRQSLWLNAKVVARAWQILGSFFVVVKIMLPVVIPFLYVPCTKLTKKLKTCTKLIQLWPCIKYCTDKLTLGHVPLLIQFLEVKLKNLTARLLKSKLTTYSYFYKVDWKCDLVFKVKWI